MKTPKEFARHYLFNILGERSGCDFRENDIDEETINETVEELANLIEKRDEQLLKGPKKLHFGLYSTINAFEQVSCMKTISIEDARRTAACFTIVKALDEKKCQFCN